MLHLMTPCGDHYKINEDGNIIRTDIKGFSPSGQWKLLGLSHVKRNAFIPFSKLTPEFLEAFEPCWKNGNPQWTVVDLDYGTTRVWGNTKCHGVKRLWLEKENF